MVQLKAALSTLEADLEDLEDSVRYVSGLYDHLVVLTLIVFGMHLEWLNKVVHAFSG